MEVEHWTLRVWNWLPRWTRALLVLVALLAALDSFFVSIGMLGAFKALGSDLGQDLIQNLAHNPIMGLFVGVLVTSILQSSSSTTSLVVGLVASATLGSDPATSVQTAIPIIMGANIGTSVTNCLVSFGHIGDKREFQRAFAAATVHDLFNLLTVIVLLPLQVATNFLGRMSLAAATFFTDAGGLNFVSPLIWLVKPQTHLLGKLLANGPIATFVLVAATAYAVLWIVSFNNKRQMSDRGTWAVSLAFALSMGGIGALLSSYPELMRSSELATLVLAMGGLFGSLLVLVKVMRGVVMTRIEHLFHNYIFKTALRSFSIGMIFTALVQSSSVTTSLIVPLAGAGLLNIQQIFPYTLGANLGTTVTAMLAALSLGNTPAIAVAMAHLLFNFCGTLIFYPLRRVPIFLAQKLAAASAAWPPTAFLFVLFVFFIIPIVLIAIVH